MAKNYSLRGLLSASSLSAVMGLVACGEPDNGVTVIYDGLTKVHYGVPLVGKNAEILSRMPVGGHQVNACTKRAVARYLSHNGEESSRKPARFDEYCNFEHPNKLNKFFLTVSRCSANRTTIECTAEVLKVDLDEKIEQLPVSYGPYPIN